jgi:hypothetical protein
MQNQEILPSISDKYFFFKFEKENQKLIDKFLSVPISVGTAQPFPISIPKEMVHN